VGIVYYENEVVGHFILFLFIHEGTTVISVRLAVGYYLLLRRYSSLVMLRLNN
jgi:hypothetical protein